MFYALTTSRAWHKFLMIFDLAVVALMLYLVSTSNRPVVEASIACLFTVFAVVQYLEIGKLRK